MSLAGDCGSRHCPPPPPFPSLPIARPTTFPLRQIIHYTRPRKYVSIQPDVSFGHGVERSPSRLLGTASVCYHVPCGQLEATMEFQKRALLPPCLPPHYDPLESVANSNTFINKVSHPRKISVLVYFCLPNTCRKY